MAGIPPVTVLAALGANPTQGSGAWAWTDVTSYVRAKKRIQITTGRLNEYSVTQASKCEFEVDNTGGRWVARNAVGPWYGRIRRNTPIQVLVGDGTNVVRASDSFTRTVVDGWGTADAGGAYTLNGAGGVVSAADFDVTGTAATVAVPSAAAYRMAFLSGIAEVDQEAYVEFTCPTPTGGNLEPGNLMLRGQSLGEYYNCRVHVTTGSAVQVQIDHSGTGTLVAATTVSGLTHSPATTFKVKAQAYGSTVRIRVWSGSVEPTVWHAEAVDPNPIAAAGWVGIRTGRASGNTNAGVIATYDNFSFAVRPVRFSGFINELPVDWDPSGRDSTVGIVASGILRRLGQGTAPLRSALYRTLTSKGWASPIQYWPMEDGSTSTSFASAIGGPALTYSGMTPAAYSGCAGSGPLPTLSATTLASGNVPVPPLFVFPGVRWSVRFVVYLPSTPASDVYPLGWYTSGTLTWRVVITALNQIRVEAFDSTFTEKLGAGLLTVQTGRAVMVGVDAVQNGGNIDWTLTYYPGVSTSGTVAGQAVGMPTAVRIGDSPALANGSVGHIAVYTSSPPPPVNAAVDGWAGTTVYSRVFGLCGDANIPISVTDGTPTTSMGSQSRSGLLALLREAEAADLGILSESGFGLRYLSRWERYNRPVELALDHRLGQVADLQPTDDDQVSRNDITATRTNGSAYRVSDPAHQALYDVYYDSPTINVFADSDVPAQASWRLHVGTVDDLRHPVLALNLRGRPELISAWKSMRIGSRITIANPPTELGTDTIDVHLEGWTETIDDGAGIWYVTANTSSALPWQVWSGAAGIMADTTGSTLTAAMTTTTSSVTVATPSGPLWNTAITHSLNVEGERMSATVTNGVADAFTRTVSNGWGNADIGGAWTTSGGVASEYATTGTVGTHTHSATSARKSCLTTVATSDADQYATASVPAVATGAPIEAASRARYIDSNSQYNGGIQFATGGAVTAIIFKRVGGVQTTLTSTTVSGLTYGAGTQIRWRFQCIGSTLQLKVWATSGTEPTDWLLSVTDTDLTAAGTLGLTSVLNAGNTNATPLAVSFDDYQVINPQAFTVIRSVNGVVKSHSTGAAVSLWRPTVPAL